MLRCYLRGTIMLRCSSECKYGCTIQGSSYVVPHELKSKLLVSPLTTAIIVPYIIIIPYIYPPPPPPPPPKELRLQLTQFLKVVTINSPILYIQTVSTFFSLLLLTPYITTYILILSTFFSSTTIKSTI